MDILLVDPNPLMQQLMARFLTDLGYQVAIANHVDEALTLVRSSVPLLFLIDLHLPDCHGIEVLEELRDIPGCSNIPAIAISGMDEHSVRTYLSPGFVTYLLKPIDLNYLEMILAHYVGALRERSINNTNTIVNA